MRVSRGSENGFARRTVSSLCQKYIIPPARWNRGSQDSALLHARDVSDKQTAFLFLEVLSQQVSAGASDPLYVSLAGVIPIMQC